MSRTKRTRWLCTLLGMGAMGVAMVPVTADAETSSWNRNTCPALSKGTLFEAPWMKSSFDAVIKKANMVYEKSDQVKIGRLNVYSYRFKLSITDYAKGSSWPAGNGAKKQCQMEFTLNARLDWSFTPKIPLLPNSYSQAAQVRVKFWAGPTGKRFQLLPGVSMTGWCLASIVEAKLVEDLRGPHSGDITRALNDQIYRELYNISKNKPCADFTLFVAPDF